MTRKLAWVDNRGVNFFLSFDPPDGRPCHGECVCRKYESNQMDFEKQVHSCWLKRSLDRTVGSEESLCAEDSVPPLFVFGVEEFVSGPFISHHSAIDVIRRPIKSKAHPTLQVSDVRPCGLCNQIFFCVPQTLPNSCLCYRLHCGRNFKSCHVHHRLSKFVPLPPTILGRFRGNNSPCRNHCGKFFLAFLRHGALTACMVMLSFNYNAKGDERCKK